MNFKKAMVTMLAATMVLGSSVSVLAASTPVVLNGDSKKAQDYEIKGTAVNPATIIKVDIPTDLGLDFEFDPLKLLNASDSDKYADATILFKKNDEQYVDKSNPIEVTNSSTCDVDVSVKGVVTDNGVTIIENDAVSSDTATKAYFKFYVTDSEGATVPGDGNSVYFVGGNGAELKTEVTKATGYKVTKSTGGAYEWDATNITPVKTYFVLTGAANANADWSALAEAPSLKLTFTATKHGVAAVTDEDPSILSRTTNSSGDLVVTYSLGSGSKAATGIEGIYSQSGSKVTIFTDNATENTLTLPAAKLQSLAGKTYTIKFTVEGGLKEVPLVIGVDN